MIARLFDNVLSGYLAACGAAFLGGAVLLSLRALRLRGGERADGVIVGYTERMRERRTSRLQYMPRFRFLGPGGEHIVQSRTGTTRPERLPPGSAVKVLYDPDDPTLAEIAGNGRIWWGPAGCMVLMIGTLLGAWRAGG